jgi:hypothetical protein
VINRSRQVDRGSPARVVKAARRVVKATDRTRAARVSVLIRTATKATPVAKNRSPICWRVAGGEGALRPAARREMHRKNAATIEEVLAKSGD